MSQKPLLTEEDIVSRAASRAHRWFLIKVILLVGLVAALLWVLR